MRKGRIIIEVDRCKGCLLCIAACKPKQIKISKKMNKTGYNIVEFCDEGKCNACTLCGIICPDAAIEVIEIIETEKK
jgi:2-oxoglutarate ferredoxin oxidoreductase subunit delta